MSVSSVGLEAELRLDIELRRLRSVAVRNAIEKGEWKSKCLALEIENERLRAAIFDLNKAFTAFNREADAAAES